MTTTTTTMMFMIMMIINRPSLLCLPVFHQSSVFLLPRFCFPLFNVFYLLLSPLSHYFLPCSLFLLQPFYYYLPPASPLAFFLPLQSHSCPPRGDLAFSCKWHYVAWDGSTVGTDSLEEERASPKVSYWSCPQLSLFCPGAPEETRSRAQTSTNISCHAACLLGAHQCMIRKLRGGQPSDSQCTEDCFYVLRSHAHKSNRAKISINAAYSWASCRTGLSTKRCVDGTGCVSR